MENLIFLVCLSGCLVEEIVVKLTSKISMPFLLSLSLCLSKGNLGFSFFLIEAFGVWLLILRVHTLSSSCCFNLISSTWVLLLLSVTVRSSILALLGPHLDILDATAGWSSGGQLRAGGGMG